MKAVFIAVHAECDEVYTSVAGPDSTRLRGILEKPLITDLNLRGQLSCATPDKDPHLFFQWLRQQIPTTGRFSNQTPLPITTPSKGER